MSDSRLKIIRGADKQLIIRIVSKNGTPKDLTDSTYIEVLLDKASGEKLSLTNINIPETAAYIKVGDVTYTSALTGAAGNLIKLIGDGVKTVQTVINDWNNANPSNMVTSNATVEQLAAIFPAGEYRLSGGYLAYSPVEIYGSPLLGTIKVTILEKETQGMKVGNNQSFAVKIDDGENTAGIRFIGIFENKLDVINP